MLNLSFPSNLLDRADKRAEKERQDKAEQERQDREEELREMSIKLRRRLA
jgi:hypothetical protein